MRALVMILLILTVPATATADWLVMKDGGRVETRGEWKIKGRTVVFTLPNGTLSSVRLDEVDLDRSAEATYEAQQASAEEEPADEPPPPPVLEITDEDIRRAAPRPAPAQPGEGEGEAGEGEAGEGGGEASQGQGAGKENVTINAPFELVTWKVEKRGEGGLEVLGTLGYRGEEEVAQGLNMIVSVRTPDGFILAETSASLRTQTLRSGAATSFRATFNEIETDDYRIAVEVETRDGRY